MKGLFILTTGCLFCLTLLAQPSVQPLIQAEKDFEQLSHKEGLKKAFVFFADSSGLAFPDSGAANAQTFWTARGGTGFFSWAPSYAEISDGGDWGYTTGAAQFRRESLQDTVSYASQYTSVWRKNKAGNWKYLMDIGISHASIPPDTVCKKVVIKKEWKGDAKKRTSILFVDKSFNDALVTNAKSAYSKFAGSHYLLNNEGHFITTTVDSAIAVFKNQPIACVSTGVYRAPKGDMAFVYGRCRRGGAEANYVRIWRNEINGWKVALEVYQ